MVGNTQQFTGAEKPEPKGLTVRAALQDTLKTLAVPHPITAPASATSASYNSSSPRFFTPQASAVSQTKTDVKESATLRLDDPTFGADQDASTKNLPSWEDIAGDFELNPSLTSNGTRNVS